MNNEQQQIIDKVYENWKSRDQDFWEEQVDGMFTSELGEEVVDRISKECFVNKCKTDTEFSKKWGLIIEERELSLEERIDWMKKYSKVILPMRKFDEEFSLEGFFKSYGVPIKLITVTRELSRDERIDLYNKEYGIPGNKYEPPFDDFIDSRLTTRNIPTNIKIESYE